jgi:pyruvate dehydrogenase E2 component (dihydrolipoamide acetyltransferase)
MIEFKLPALGADMDEATLLEWNVQPGDVIKKGQVVAVVDTTKAAVDIECWQEGTVGELLVQPGEKIPVGTPLATLLEAGEKTAPKKAGGAAGRAQTCEGTWRRPRWRRWNRRQRRGDARRHRTRRNQGRTDRQGGGNAKGHCRGDEPFQTRDPALLPG